MHASVFYSVMIERFIEKRLLRFFPGFVFTNINPANLHIAANEACLANLNNMLQAVSINILVYQKTSCTRMVYLLFKKNV